MNNYYYAVLKQSRVIIGVFNNIVNCQRFVDEDPEHRELVEA